jgi:hypothetical protein
MAIQYTNLFQYKAAKIYPNWDFCFENVPPGNPAQRRFYLAKPKSQILSTQFELTSRLPGLMSR